MKIGDRVRVVVGSRQPSLIGVIIAPALHFDFRVEFKHTGTTGWLAYNEGELELVDNGLDTMLRIAFDE